MKLQLASDRRKGFVDGVWPPRLFYPVIAVASALVGGFYTDRYSGWGHDSINAVPVAFGLMLFAFLVSAIAVSQMNQRTANFTLGGFSCFWVLFARLIYIVAPS